MNTRREEFGKYLLLKKLAEDPLGESFRAGRVGGQGLDQVVLLRTWNGSGTDGEALWAAIEPRVGVQQALKSPNIGSGVDAGRVRGVPYAAYDYVSGKNLARLAAQAEREHSPFPTDHALLIAERLGLALAAAYETRHGGDRVLHGFVVPHLVMVSNEGETRLLGFEAGPGLAAQAARFPEEIQRYLAPEARGGQPGDKSDDVFSLGAILYELLTGAPLPAVPPEGGYGALLERAQLAAEGVPLPTEMKTLLAKSLAPRGERTGDVATWHKEISRLMTAADYNPTTFNLAFFMHNLFRDEIERESREIEAEKTMEIPAATGASVAPVGAETMALPQEEVRAAAAGPAARPAAAAEPEAPGRSKAPLWIALAAVLVLAVLAGAYFGGFLDGVLGGGAAEELAAAPPPVAEPEPAAPEGPSPEELQAQINQMLDERADAMEASLKEQYDERLASLQGQLQQAQDAATERARRLEEEQRLARAEAARLEAEAAAAELEKQKAAELAATREPEPAARTAPAEGTTRQASLDGGGPPGPAAGSDGAAAIPPEPEPQKPAVPDVQRGELVHMGPGVTPPSVRQRAEPSYPPAARRLGRQATIDVRVLVDENGRVIDAEVDGRNPGLGFDKEALRAARSSTFNAADKNGVPVKMWTTLRFVFRP